jgi:hypothetical protein
MNDEAENEGDSVLEMPAVDAEIADGVKALNHLFRHAGDDFTKWEIVIKGFRALRNLAFASAHTSDIQAYDYRQAMGSLLRQRKYAAYDHLDRPTRSACYKLMDSIEDISLWYAALPAADKLRWTHPQSIVKNAPRHLVAGGRGHNKPKKTGQKKRASSAEEDRLRQILIAIIEEFVRPSNPQRADELLKQVYPAGDPNDSLDDLTGDDEGAP